jgi:hypothetical protein
VYAIIADDRVNGRMKLYAGDFSASELAFSPDGVDVIAGELAENRAEASAYSGLLAVEDRVVSYDVRADSIF